MTTNPKVQISASIMCIDWLQAGRDLAILEYEGIDYLHWDVIDGQFAPDFTMGSSIINRLRETSKIASDYHLMVIEPSRLFKAFTVSPNDFYVIHQECARNLHRDLVTIRRMGCRAGIAISPGTSLETLEYVIEDADIITLMTVNPGYAGQPLVPQTLRKIEKLRRMIDDLKLNTLIEVDGHVSTDVVADMVAAGADILVGGSSGLFRRDIGLEKAIGLLREQIEIGLTRRRGA